MPRLTARFDEALKYAHDVHREQVRKGNQSPYIGHLMAVASIVLDDGGSEDETIGALLHDAAEDHGGRSRLEEIRARFGDSVAKIVEDCTDSWETPKRPWIDRKREYVEHAHTIGTSSLRVSSADKVHNAYGILRDLRNSGETVWERFNAPADDVVMYYASLVKAFRHAGGGRLVDELDKIVKGIQREMGY
jgi:(p)ppGpp synthase/HD superfamily hydrolase